MNRKILSSFAKALVSVFILTASGILYISHAATVETTLSTQITNGNLSLLFLDDQYEPVVSPSIAMEGVSYDVTSKGETSGTLGTATEMFAIVNNTNTLDTWTVSIAASDGAGALWSDGGTESFDFNDVSGDEDGVDTDGVGGQLTINPQTGTLSEDDPINGITKGSQKSFVEGVDGDSITLLSANGAATSGAWFFNGTRLEQVIPAGQEPGTYTLGLTITVQ